MFRNLVLFKNNKQRKCINKLKNLCASGNSNGKKDDDYFLMLIATYLSYYYQK